MAKFTKEQVEALNLTDAQRIKAKRIFQGKKLSKSEEVIEVENEETLKSYLATVPSGDGGKAKREFNSKVIEAAKKAQKCGFTLEQIVGAIDNLCAEKIKEQTKAEVIKLMGKKGFTKEQIIEALG